VFTADAIAPTFLPCRRHLVDLLFDLPETVRSRAYWRMPIPAWEAILRNPELKSNWKADGNYLFDLHVVLANCVNHVQLVVTQDGHARYTVNCHCRPGE
jgi:hypothetical protein